MRGAVPLVILLALGVAAPVGAQEPGNRWELRLDASRDAFSGGSTDTTTIPGTEVEVAPAPRMALEVGVSRELGVWRLGLGVGYASGGLRAKAPALILDDRTAEVTRYRAALLVSRQLIWRGAASLHLLAGPAVDQWSAAGIGDRTTLSCRLGLSARLWLGGLALENTITIGVGESPFQKDALPREARPRALRTLSFGAGLRLPL